MGMIAGALILFLFLAFLPLILAKILDPINITRIHRICEASDCTEIKVKAFPNHYGVTFRKGGKAHYLKCKAVGFKIKWKGQEPKNVT